MFAIELFIIGISIVDGTNISGNKNPIEIPVLTETIPTMVEYTLSFFGNQLAENFDMLELKIQQNKPIIV